MTRLILVARPAAGGLRSHLISLLQRLDRSRWKIQVAAPASLLGSLPGLQKDEQLRLAITPRPSVSDLAAIRGLCHALKSAPARVVHAHGIRAAWIAALAHSRAPFPLVATLHNIPPEGPFSSIALRLIASQTDRIICVSHAVAARIPSDRKQVVANGIDLARFANLDRSAARRCLGIENSSFVVAAAARLAPEKGIDLLLKAARLCPEMTFLVAGSGPDEQKLRDEAPANARFLGRIEEVPALFAASDAVVVPSRSEGQGISALEAMAAGASVVAANVGGLPEMVKDGATGLLVPPGDPGALQNALETLRSDRSLRRRLGAAGQAFAQTHGDINRMIETIEEVYEEVVRAKG